MINTDKYEGHTPAPWEYFYAKNCDDWILKTPLYIHSGKGVRMKKDSVDAQLIADAPLLLEEVKRLREVDEIKFTIDDYDKVVNSEYKGYYVTLYINGCEYIGALRLYKDEEGKVIE